MIQRPYLRILLVIGLLSSACAREPHPEVERAEMALSRLEADPAVQQFASRELQETQNVVQQARKAWRRNGNEAEVQHLTYLAGRRMNITQLKAAEEHDELVAQRLHGQRDRLALAGEAARAREGERRARARLASREAEISRLQEELQMEQTSRGLLLTLDDVLFETGRAELKPGADRKLAPLAEFLRLHDEQVVTIEGHTDSRGSYAYNRDLSLRRAEAVRNSLVNQGIAAQRITAFGLGEEYPRASNDSAAGRLENRRVEIYVKSPS